MPVAAEMCGVDICIIKQVFMLAMAQEKAELRGPNSVFNYGNDLDAISG